MYYNLNRYLIKNKRDVVHFQDYARFFRDAESLRSTIYNINVVGDSVIAMTVTNNALRGNLPSAELFNHHRFRERVTLRLN